MKQSPRPMQLSTDLPTTAPRCISILVRVGVHQKLGKDRNTFTRKAKMKINAMARNEDSNPIFNIFRRFIQGSPVRFSWLGR